MGTNVTGSLDLSASVAGFFGLIAQAEAIGWIDQPGGKGSERSVFK